MLNFKTASWIAAAGALIGAIWSWQSTPQTRSMSIVQPEKSVQIASLLIPASTQQTTVRNRTKVLAPAPTATAISNTPQTAIGSEGYGPHIERASVSGDAKLAWQAVTWLQRCLVNETQTQPFQTARDNGVQPETMTLLIQDEQAVGRRCQTVTAQHWALLSDLALEAMRGQMAGAAVAFAGSRGFEQPSSAMQVEVLEAIRRDAAAGDTSTLLGAIPYGGKWGLSASERLTYLATYIGLSDPPEAILPAVRMLLERSDLKDAVISGEQMAIVRAASQRMITLIKTKKAPG